MWVCVWREGGGETRKLAKGQRESEFFTPCTPSLYAYSVPDSLIVC